MRDSGQPGLGSPSADGPRSSRRAGWRGVVAPHACLVLLFASCWFVQHLVSRHAEALRRDLVPLSNRTLRTMAVLDFTAAHFWLPAGYMALVFAAVGFLQFRRRPAWTCWLAALVFSIPSLAYAAACARAAWLAS